MPISATGNRLAPDAGVTLVEALTALMIVGLMAGAVILMAPGAGRTTRIEAERLAARAALASEESIIANRPVSLVVTDNGYGFERLEDNGWFPAEQRSPLAFRPWPANIDVRVEQRAGEADDPRVVRFDATGGASPARLVLSGAGVRWRVDIDAQGRAYVTQAE